VGALAVDEGTTDNAQLLAGGMSLLRAVAEELSHEGSQVHIALRGKDLCLEDAELGLPLCVRPRPGLILFGSPPALSAFEALPPVAAPVAAPGEPPVLLSLRVDMGVRGHGRLAFTGRDAVRLSLSLEGGSPRDIAALEAVVKKAITEYDAHRQNVRESVTAGLAEVQRSIAEDATAPASLKQAASTLTADQVVDAHGYWAQMRQSLQVASTQDRFSLFLTVPAGAVKDVSEALSSSGLPLAVMGSLAAVAIPNFMKFQGRSKQAEVRANLKSAYTAQRIYFQERDKWGRTFEDIGFAPEKGRRYTYCMGKQCLPCDGAGCKVSPPPSPCQGLTSVGQGARDGFSICAYANLDSDDTWDVWVVDQNGEPQNLSNDLE
jgi:type II secretory pathway pseudopilin PulG